MSISAVSNSLLFARTQQAYSSVGIDDESDGTEFASAQNDDNAFEDDDSNDGGVSSLVGSVLDVQA